MTEYTVSWEIDIEADNSDEAAQQALDIQRDSNSTATIFYVRQSGKELHTATYIDVATLNKDTL